MDQGTGGAFGDPGRRQPSQASMRGHFYKLKRFQEEILHFKGP